MKNNIDLKKGIKYFCITAFLFLVEIIVYFTIGFSAQAASGNGIVFFFNAFYFFIILTGVVSVSFLVVSIGNRKFKINIKWQAMFLAAIAIAAIIFWLL